MYHIGCWYTLFKMSCNIVEKVFECNIGKESFMYHKKKKKTCIIRLENYERLSKKRQKTLPVLYSLKQGCSIEYQRKKN